MSYSTDRAIQLAKVLERTELEDIADRLGTGFEPAELEREDPP